jgi:RNA polymerase sigma-70 factor, ECF subfamily
MSSPPLQDQPHRDAAAWSQLVAALDQDTMIALIGSWMGSTLRQSATPEDIWQETLALAWRDRAAHDWRGMSAFRAWLRGIATNRIRDTAERAAAQKRGGGQRLESFSNDSQRSDDGILPAITTTPSREAGRHERARVLREALESLDDEYRDLVRMCLFEEMSVPMAARQLGMADSTAYRRLMRGAAVFRARIREVLGPGTTGRTEGS